MIDSKNLARIMATVSKKDVMKTVDNLSEIVVALPNEALRTPGVLASVATELAINDVNLITSTAPPNPISS